MKRPKINTPNILFLAGIFFLVVGAIEIIVGIKNTNSTVLGTMYILASIIVQSVQYHSQPIQVTSTFKPEVVDLLEWSHKNLPQSNHPDLCAVFVEEFRKRFDAAQAAPSNSDIISIQK